MRYHSLDLYSRLQVKERKVSADAKQHMYLNFDFKGKVLTWKQQKTRQCSLSAYCSVLCAVSEQNTSQLRGNSGMESLEKIWDLAHYLCRSY